MRVETPLFDGLPIGVVTSSVDCNRYLLNAAYWLAAAASSCFVGKSERPSAIAVCHLAEFSGPPRN